MVRKLLFIYVLLSLALAGCLQSPSKFKEVTLETGPKVVNNIDCTCMLCTNSTGNTLLDVFTPNNDLKDGSCYFKQNCSRLFVYRYLNYDKLNFVKDFGIGQGATYTEFEEATMRCNTHAEYVLRVLYSKYRPPFYDKSGLFGLLDTNEGDAIECALKKGTIPFYIFYTEGTYIKSDWIPDFMKNADIEGSVFISPEALFDVKDVGAVIDQVNAIQSGCKQKVVVYNSEVIQVSGCKIALFPKQGNPLNDTPDYIFTVLDAVNNRNKDLLENKISAIITTLNINQKDYGCDAGFALANAMNRSRYILNKYGKPSFLIISIDSSCESKKNEIVDTVYTSIEYMRMTGIFGMAYSQYFSYNKNPLKGDQGINSNIITLGRDTNSVNIDEWFKLCKYYNDLPYKKEPIVFQSNGVNITNACEYVSVHRMRAIDSNVLSKYDSKKISVSKNIIGKLNYSLCIPEVDFGSIENVARGWKDWDNYQVNTDQSACVSGYPKVEVYAEHCGISRHLLRAFEKENVLFNDCDDWYEVENELAKKNFVSYADLNPNGNYESAFGKVAFMYVLKKENPGYYNSILKDHKIKNVTITAENLYLVCNGVESSGDQQGNNGFSADATPCMVLKDYAEYRDKCSMKDLYKYIVGIDVPRDNQQITTHG